MLKLVTSKLSSLSLSLHKNSLIVHKFGTVLKNVVLCLFSASLFSMVMPRSALPTGPSPLPTHSLLKQVRSKKSVILLGKEYMYKHIIDEKESTAMHILVLKHSHKPRVTRCVLPLEVMELSNRVNIFKYSLVSQPLSREEARSTCI